MIELNRLTKRFGAVRALDGVSLNIAEGSVVAIFGANGSGKSTLLMLMAGLLRPTTGTVALAGGDPRNARAHLGYLGHTSFLFPYLTSLENLRFYAGLYGVGGSRPQELLGRVGLSHRADFQARTLSRGETQRLGLARALIADPDYLLLDEPLTGLDRTASDDFASLVLREGRTVVMSTHDAALGELATTTVTLDQGRLLAG